MHRLGLLTVPPKRGMLSPKGDDDMAMTSAEQQRQYRAKHGRKPDPNRKESDKRYREKHREEILAKNRAYREAHPEFVARENEKRREREHAKQEKIVHEMIEHYFFEWVSIGVDRIFRGDEIWANKDAIRGWLTNKDNWSEEDKVNFSKLRKKDIPRLVDGISDRVIEQIALNEASLEINW